MDVSRSAGGLRVGLDLVSVPEVLRAVATHGERYLQRLFTDHERASCVGEPIVVARGLAARLAAKEATLKVLRPGSPAPPWRSIEVVRAEGGWVTLQLTGASAALKEDAGLSDLAVSLTHEGDTAAAVVVGFCVQQDVTTGA